MQNHYVPENKRFFFILILLLLLLSKILPCTLLGCHVRVSRSHSLPLFSRKRYPVRGKRTRKGGRTIEGKSVRWRPPNRRRHDRTLRHIGSVLHHKNMYIHTLYLCEQGNREYNTRKGGVATDRRKKMALCGISYRP